MNPATGSDPHAGSAPAGVREFHAQGTCPGAPGLSAQRSKVCAWLPRVLELGARPHPPRDLYRAYLEPERRLHRALPPERYGWVAPGEEISGLEDEYRLAPPHMPKLVIHQGRLGSRRGVLKRASRPDQGRRTAASIHLLHPTSTSSQNSSATLWLRYSASGSIPVQAQPPPPVVAGIAAVALPSALHLDSSAARASSMRWSACLEAPRSSGPR